MIKLVVYERCKKCNRPLKQDRAKIRGYGDYCWKQHVAEVKAKKRKLI